MNRLRTGEMMKVLMINKFLHPNGGSETYIFKLGAQLEAMGHEVQYFGMDHPNRCVSNRVQSYTSNMDFHGGRKIKKLAYPLQTIYSAEARHKLRLVLDDFQPDVCHLNNFNYQLTPSILLEIEAWKKQTGRVCRVVFTAHDSNLICPNHMMRIPSSQRNCEKCLDGNYFHCTTNRCIHGSLAKSAVGTAEAFFWHFNGVYKCIDAVICCSEFLKRKFDQKPVFAPKTVALHNFVDTVEAKDVVKQDYVLYFGRFSKEKGVGTLLDVCRALPHIPFVFAGSGPLVEAVNEVTNVRNVGFQSGEALEKLIREAQFSICPSECYENCPFTVMESQQYGTPVLGADIGGIPELIRARVTGELFESGNADQLRQSVERLWNDRALTEEYSLNCAGVHFDTAAEYCEKLLPIYQLKTE